MSTKLSGRPTDSAGPVSCLTVGIDETSAEGFGLAQQFSFPSSNCIDSPLSVTIGEEPDDGVGEEIGLVRRVRRLSGEAISRLTVGGLGLFGLPLAGLLSEETLRKRVLFRDNAGASAPEFDDVPDVAVLTGTLNLLDFPVVFLVEHDDDAADDAATTEIFDSVLLGLGSGRTLRSCMTDTV